MNPNYAKARRHATRRLIQELSPKLSYHNLAHTLDVIERAVDLGERIGVDETDMLLLKTAAAYHDIGFIDCVAGHEQIGAEYAGEVLGEYGYSAEQIVTVQELILATQLSRTPQTLLEQIMSDADLDILGRPDFLSRSCDLRDEVNALGNTISLREWYLQQHRFLSSQTYSTATARDTREAGKADNLKLLMRLVDEIDAKKKRTQT
ncbi:MAG: HD domain-containing protein [Candidatus Promineifilaceae bacterium]